MIYLPIYCPFCEADTCEYLGRLGARAHYRCRYCGMEQSASACSEDCCDNVPAEGESLCDECLMQSARVAEVKAMGEERHIAQFLHELSMVHARMTFGE